MVDIYSLQYLELPVNHVIPSTQNYETFKEQKVTLYVE